MGWGGTNVLLCVKDLKLKNNCPVREPSWSTKEGKWYVSHLTWYPHEIFTI